MSNIPTARKQVLATATHLEKISQQAQELSAHAKRLASDLRAAEDLMYKNVVKRRAAQTSARMTPDMAAAICNYADHHPEASAQEIGNIFNVNPGRVSEALSRANPVGGLRP